MIKNATVANSAEFQKLAVEWSRQLQGRDIILLEGEMGAGKTLWVRRVVEHLGGKWVSSPSFAMIQRYATRDPNLFADHVDIFRVKNEADLESTGFWDLFSQKNGLIFVEWADRLPEGVWPHNFHLWQIKITIPSVGSESRDVEIVQVR